METSQTPLDSVANAAHLVVSGKAAPFHFLVQGLSFQDTTIPDLGVFVFPERIVLDYRMGSAWGPAELMALFELLKEIRQLDPNAKITLAEEILPTIRERFDTAWRNYLVNESN